MTKTSTKKAAPEATAGRDPLVIFSRKTPHKSAEIYRQMVRPTLIRFQHQWYAWDQLGAYRVIEDETIEAEIGALAIKAKVRTHQETKDHRRRGQSADRGGSGRRSFQSDAARRKGDL